MRRLPLLLVLLAASAASAQPEYRRSVAAPSVSFDVAHAIGDDLHFAGTASENGGPYTVDIGITSLVLTASARVPLVGRWAVVAEVPLMVSRFAQTVTGDLAGQESGTDTQMDLGNVEAGVELALRDGLRVGGRVRLPTTTRGAYCGEGDADTAYSGLATDQEHLEAYVSNVLALTASADIDVPVRPHLGVRLRLAPDLLVNTEDSDQTDVALGYGAHADLAVGPAVLSVGGVGRQYAKSDGFGGLFETDLALVIGESAEIGGVRPGLTARIPVFERYQFSDAVVAVSLDVPIR